MYRSMYRYRYSACCSTQRANSGPPTPQAGSCKEQAQEPLSHLVDGGVADTQPGACFLPCLLLLTQQAALTGRCDRAPVPVLLLFNTTPQSTGAATGKIHRGSRTHETDTRTSRTTSKHRLKRASDHTRTPGRTRPQTTAPHHTPASAVVVTCLFCAKTDLKDGGVLRLGRFNYNS